MKKEKSRFSKYFSSFPKCFEEIFRTYPLQSFHFKDKWLHFLLIILFNLSFLIASFYCDQQNYSVLIYTIGLPDSYKSARIFGIDVFSTTKLAENSGAYLLIELKDNPPVVVPNIKLSCNATLFYESQFALFLDSPSKFMLNKSSTVQLFSRLPVPCDTLTINCKLSGDISIIRGFLISFNPGNSLYDRFTTLSICIIGLIYILFELYYILGFALSFKVSYLQYCMYALLCIGGIRFHFIPLMISLLPNESWRIVIGALNSFSYSGVRFIYVHLLDLLSLNERPHISFSFLLKIFFFLGYGAIIFVDTSLKDSLSENITVFISKLVLVSHLYTATLTANEWFLLILMPCSSRYTPCFKNTILFIVAASWLSFWATFGLQDSELSEANSALYYFLNHMVDPLCILSLVSFVFYKIKPKNVENETTENADE